MYKQLAHRSVTLISALINSPAEKGWGGDYRMITFSASKPRVVSLPLKGIADEY